MTRLGNAPRTAFKKGVEAYQTGFTLEQNPIDYDKAKAEGNNAMQAFCFQLRMWWQTSAKRGYEQDDQDNAA